MAEILRVKLRWTGFQGAPGYSIFHMRDFSGTGSQSEMAQAAVDRIDAFAEVIKGLVPLDVTLAVESDVEVIEDTNGNLLSIASATPAPGHKQTVGAGQPFAGPVGAVVGWRTGGVRNSRRVHGRTFLVPLSSTAFEGNGSLSSSTITTLQAGCATLIDGAGSPDMGVWARPTAPAATDGVWHAATGYRVPDMAAVLRSRRD